MKRYWFFAPVLALGFAAFLLAGCDSTGSTPSAAGGTMTLNMAGASGSTAATEALAAPSASSPTIQEARVTISQISVVPAADTSTGDSTDAGISVLSTENVEVDLIDLQAGLDTTLAELELSAGTYSQIRLITNEQAQLTFDDGSQEDVMIASGQQTGLKVNFDPFTLDTARDSVQVTLNWDVQNSLKGSAQGQFVITPVIDATVASGETGN
jgi:hypothetical protein